jgi:hypothetical protein
MAPGPSEHRLPAQQVAHTDVLIARGIRAWRENPNTFYWRSTTAAEQSRITRLLRLSDALLPLGRRAAPAVQQRASYFVRVGLPAPLWKLHARRIEREARRMGPGEMLHLWWHPHNLGDAPERKVGRIAELLDVVRAAAMPGTKFSSMGDLATE